MMGWLMCYLCAVHKLVCILTQIVQEANKACAGGVPLARTRAIN